MPSNDPAKCALRLLGKYSVFTAPVPVEKIAVDEGVQVVRSSAPGTESGFILRDDDRVVIGVNSRTSRRRQRFTIAHELGHLNLHIGHRVLIVDHVVRINKRDEISSAATDHEEIQANAFAAELLMPAGLVQVAVDREQRSGIETRDELIQTLAEEFDVSTDAMGFRLINLGVFSS
jgi:Zn-dependent peptidase ImmA (M78 family)